MLTRCNEPDAVRLRCGALLLHYFLGAMYKFTLLFSDLPVFVGHIPTDRSLKPLELLNDTFSGLPFFRLFDAQLTNATAEQNSAYKPYNTSL